MLKNENRYRTTTLNQSGDHVIEKRFLGKHTTFVTNLTMQCPHFNLRRALKGLCQASKCAFEGVFQVVNDDILRST